MPDVAAISAKVACCVSSNSFEGRGFNTDGFSTWNDQVPGDPRHRRVDRASPSL